MEINNISQILLCDDEWLDWNLNNCKNILEYKKQSILKVFTNSNYTLYTNHSIHEFLYNFDKEVFDSFNKLKPYAFRADLARYCLLYKYGGWYFDLSLTPLFKPKCTKDHLVIFNMYEKYIENFILYAKPNTDFYSRLIKQCVYNIKHNIYGPTFLSVTGPNVCKNIFDTHCITSKKLDFCFGKYNQPTREITINNRLFSNYKQDQNTWGSIDYMGFKGTNKYAELYVANQIYNQ